jgi:hypothetical protein
MQTRTLKLLDDVRDAAQFVLDRTAGLSAAAYESDRLLRQADGRFINFGEGFLSAR